MKKLLTIAFTIVLGATLSFAQGAGSKGSDSTAKPATSNDTKTASSTKTGKKGHKGGKKSKKNSGGSTTPPPK